MQLDKKGAARYAEADYRIDSYRTNKYGAYQPIWSFVFTNIASYIALLLTALSAFAYVVPRMRYVIHCPFISGECNYIRPAPSGTFCLWLLFAAIAVLYIFGIIPMLVFMHQASDGNIDGYIEEKGLKVYTVVDRSTGEVVCYTPMMPKLDLEEAGAWGVYVIKHGLEEPRY